MAHRDTSVSAQRRRRRAGLNGLRSSVPVRTFGDWGDPAPGFVEVDLVAHCGGTVSGSFVWTLTLTDIASGWTECVPLLVREARLVVDALDQLRGALPFPLRGIDTDNGSEFLNEVLVAFCREQDIELTRSRPFRKNDQAWVEQKERRRRPPAGRVRPPGGRARGRGAGAPLLGRATVRERVPAVVQARREDPPRRPGSEALPRAGDAVRAVVGIGCDSRRDEGPTSRRARHIGPARAVGRDPGRSASSRCPRRRGDGPSDARTRRRPRRVPAEPRARLARRRGAADTSGSEETTPTLAHSAGSVRDESGPASSSGWRPNRIGPRKSSSTASAGNSPGRSSPASFGPCSPRPRLAASGRPSSPLRRSDGITPERRRVADHSRRAERDRGGRDRARPGMPERLHRPVAPAATISVLGVPMRRRVTARTGRKGGNARQGGSTVASVGAVHDVAARRWNASEALAGLRLGICLHSADTAAIVYPDKSCKL